MLRPRLAVQIAIRGVSKEGRKDKQTDRWTNKREERNEGWKDRGRGEKGGSIDSGVAFSLLEAAYLIQVIFPCLG